MAILKCRYCSKTCANPGALRFHLAKCAKAPESVRRKNAPKLKGIPHPKMRKANRTLNDMAARGRAMLEDHEHQEPAADAGRSPDRQASPAPSAGSPGPSGEEIAEAPHPTAPVPTEPGELPPPPPSDVAEIADEKEEVMAFTRELKTNLQERGPVEEPDEDEEENLDTHDLAPDPVENPQDLAIKSSKRSFLWLWILGAGVLAAGLALALGAFPKKEIPPSMKPLLPKIEEAKGGAIDPWDR